MEGYAIPSNLGLAFEHAFITINDKVFDPTWGDQEKIVYFGVPFSVDEVIDFHLNKKRKMAGMIGAWDLGFPYLKTRRNK